MRFESHLQLAPSAALSSCEFASSSKERAKPRCLGSGAVSKAFAFARLLPVRLLATEASPQPDCLGHLLSQTRCVRAGEPQTRIRVRQRMKLYAPIAPVASSFRSLPQRGSHRASPREGRCDPPRPRCLPSPNLPTGAGLCPHAVPSLWIRGLRFFNLRSDPFP